MKLMSGCRAAGTALALAILPPGPAVAAGVARPAGPNSAACLRAAGVATREAGLPAGLLAAIGIVETGRHDPATGRLVPSPFAVDAAGDGHWFGDARTAAADVRAARGRGIARIDVGCFQIDLAFHPHAFPTLADAFDPDANAAVAARFLDRLHRRYDSWAQAVAAYHSATPDLGARYAARVMATWTRRTNVAASGSRDPHVLSLGPPQVSLPRIVEP